MQNEMRKYKAKTQQNETVNDDKQNKNKTKKFRRLYVLLLYTKNPNETDLRQILW